MIFWFSGTGNSLRTAKTASLHLGETLHPMSCPPSSRLLPEGKYIGFVFPVYSWGVPPNVLKFIKSIPDAFFSDVKLKALPVWCIMTYGDEAAMAPEMFRSTLERRGVKVEGIWGLQQPNNYVLLPGFDVDPENLEVEKTIKGKIRTIEILNKIKFGEWEDDYTKGSHPWLKTKLIWPLFKKWGIKPYKWRFTNACIGCGKCEKACPIGNVTMKNRTPEWGAVCVSCLACYHVCPRHAVEYGKATINKGQYFAH